MFHLREAADRMARRDAVYDAIVAAALAGATAPTNRELGDRAGLGPSWVVSVLNQMEAAGQIEVERFSASRIIRIPALGLSTAAPPAGSKVKHWSLR